MTSDRNVFSLYPLKPNTEYTVEVEGHEPVHFTTISEACAVSVKDFGAVGDGVHDDTENIQTAVNCLPEGGRLYFPEGTYSTAPINLKSAARLDGCFTLSRYPGNRYGYRDWRGSSHRHVGGQRDTHASGVAFRGACRGYPYRRKGHG